MATMRDMPYMAGKVVTVRSWHKPQLNPLKGYFHPQKGASKPDIGSAPKMAIITYIPAG